MRRMLLAVVLVLAATLVARADVFVLTDGEVVEGTLVSKTDDEFVVRLATGQVRRVPREGTLHRKETAPEPSPSPARPVSRSPAPSPSAAPAPRAAPTPTAPPAPEPGVNPTSDPAAAALRRAASDGLEDRARLVVGASDLATYVAVQEGGSWTMSARPRPVSLETARFADRSAEELAHELWYRRGTTPAERAKALNQIAGVVAWVEGEVLDVKEAGGAFDTEVQLASPVLRRRTAIRRRARPDWKAHDRIKLACMLLLKREASAQFLSTVGGDSLSGWPMDVTLVAAEVASSAPATQTTDSPRKLAERILAQRVKQWLTNRTKLLCHACAGAKRIVCPACNGAAMVPRVFLAEGVRWIPCGRCGAVGWHTCALCKDGLCEMVLKDSLRTFGTYGRPLGAFLAEGQSIVVDPDGTRATVKTWVRDTATDQPRCETAAWVLDAQFGWKPAG